MPEIADAMPAGMRKPPFYWQQFLDGQVHVFTEGVDFAEGDAERLRATIHSSTRHYNTQWDRGSENIVTLVTRRRKDDQGRWKLYVQATFPNDQPS